MGTKPQRAKTKRSAPTGPKPFEGVIKLDVRDSVADWGTLHPNQSARGFTEHFVRSVRRHGTCCMVTVRRQD